MVNISTNPTTPIKPSTGKTDAVTPVSPSPIAKENAEQKKLVKPRVERRKNQDRRRQANSRGPYDMRSGRDRRRNKPGSTSIDLKA